MLSTRRAAGVKNENGKTGGIINAKAQRRRVEKTRKREVESVGVGFPNPLGCGLGNQAPTMDHALRILPHLAPEGRNVYSTWHAPNNQSPSGAICGSVAHRETRRGWVPQPIGRGDLAPTMRAGHRIWVLLVHLAPEGRYVYSRWHTPNNQSPSGAICGSVAHL